MSRARLAEERRDVTPARLDFARRNGERFVRNLRPLCHDSIVAFFPFLFLPVLLCFSLVAKKRIRVSRRRRSIWEEFTVMLRPTGPHRTASPIGMAITSAGNLRS